MATFTVEYNGPRDARATDRFMETVIEAGGGLVIDFADRVGARPYARFTPYTNVRGVRVHHWTVISVLPKAMPGRTLLFHPEVVDPHASEDYPLRHFSTPWIWQEVYHSRRVEAVPATETPFAGDAWRWEGDDQEVEG